MDRRGLAGGRCGNIETHGVETKNRRGNTESVPRTRARTPTGLLTEARLGDCAGICYDCRPWPSSCHVRPSYVGALHSCSRIWRLGDTSINVASGRSPACVAARRMAPPASQRAAAWPRTERTRPSRVRLGDKLQWRRTPWSCPSHHLSPRATARRRTRRHRCPAGVDRAAMLP